MVKLFEFGRFYYYTSYPFILTYIYYLVNHSNEDLAVEGNQISKMLVVVIIYNLSSIFGGVFSLIIWFRTVFDAAKKRKPRARRSQIEKEIEQRKKITVLKKLFHYAVVIILDTATTFWFSYQSVLVKFIEKPIYIETIKRALLIAFCILFSYLLLGVKLERFQVFALLVCGLGIVINFVLSFLEHGITNIYQIYAIGIEFINNFLNAIMVVEEKMLMHYYFQSPYIVIFFQGIIGTLLAGFGLFFYVIAAGDYENIKTIPAWLAHNSNHIVAFMLVTLAYTVFRFLVNKTTTPTHRLIYDTCYCLLLQILRMIQEKFKAINFGYLIGYILLVLGSLIYHEVIIILFWGLKRDTREEVAIRGMLEHAKYPEKFDEIDLDRSLSIPDDDEEEDYQTLELNSS